MKSTDGTPNSIGRIKSMRILSCKPISNTKRVERVLNLIIWLKEYRTIRGIAKYLDIHEKSVNRYLNLLVQLGFDVEVSHGKSCNYYQIKNTKEYFKIE